MMILALLVDWTLCAGQARKENKKMTHEAEFDALCGMTGKAYDTARDHLLASTPELPPLLDERAAKKDWHIARTADILRGWSQHNAKYKKFLAELDAVDVQTARKTAAGVSGIVYRFVNLAKAEYKSEGLPLWWEALLKHSHEWEPWRVEIILRILDEIPDSRSVEPLLWYIETTDRDPYRELAARALTRQPRAGLEERIAQVQAKHAHSAQAKDEHIMAVLTKAAERLHDGEE
jgi:hypothetical protein